MYTIPCICRLVFQLGLLAAVPVLGWSQITLLKATPCGAEAFPGSCTIPSTGSGHLVVIGLQLQGGSTATTVSGITDNAGNVYAEAGAARSSDSGGGDVVDIWYAKNSIAAATSITITTSASMSSCAAVVWEFSGADLTAPLDQTVTLSNQAATATPSGAPVTIQSANDIIISLADVANAVTGIVSGNPFVSDSALFSAAWPNVTGWAHLITSSPGTYSAQWNQNASGTYASSTASFKAAASGSGSGTGACDVNKDGSTNVLDVQVAANNAVSCTTAAFQTFYSEVISGVLSSCPVTNGLHTVSLNWTASTTSGVTYNVYRATTSGGYNYSSPLATGVAGTSFIDCSVTLGQAYYYVIKAVDALGNQSIGTPEVSVAIPSS